MGLKEYKKKRSFEKSPEPTGLSKTTGSSKTSSSLIFVVQKHAASHLHYDFRLEVNGVLKSWAVPKGPSLNPKEKHLAMMVEDHPYDYHDFEGIIPEGNYGAGTVMVWDTGVYYPVDENYQIAGDKAIAKGIENGKIMFGLDGKKLRGLFTLVKLKNAQKDKERKDNEWLLMKIADDFATDTDILNQDRSVLTKRTMNQIARQEPSKDKKKESPSHPQKNQIAKQEASKNKKKISPSQPQLTNLDKVYWPKEGYTKGDLIDYYRHIAPLILPQLKDRPQSLHRYPNGIEAKDFFQKNIDDQMPDWVSKVMVKHSKETINYLLIPDEKTLLFTINLGCIDLNPFNSRIQSLENPDYLVIDLDPENVPFSQVIETAQTLHEILETHEIPSYCKTSGATGMHIYLPLGAQYPYEPVKQFAQLLASLTHEQLPKITSLERSPSKRQRKVYLDYLQNNFGQTLAAPYAVRPRPGATVSTPLEWKEVKEGLDPTDFTMKNIQSRLKKKGDLFKGVLGKGINLLKCLKKLSQ
ncbi:MAG: non-homologous end-joining DNA ligase [Parachlamydia sp.]|nr:non-homologous end-joining DNA ligase [Parachlamydia sp.]